MGLTLVCKSLVIDNNVTLDATIAAALNAVTTTHVYGVSVVPISNTQSRVIMTCD